MTESPVPSYGPTSTLPLPPPSANGVRPLAPAGPARVTKTARTRTRIKGMRTGLIAGAARITQLRRIMRRARRRRLPE
jgi:hypothetical protein